MKRRTFLAGLFSLPILSKRIIPAAAPDTIAPYKGLSTFDQGSFYCPYIPLQGVSGSAIQTTNIFKTRYGEIKPDDEHFLC